MFVAQLDRPWLETPFLFQGFEIGEQNEIGLLRKFCKHVYVDVERSTIPKDQILAARNSVKRGHDPFVKDNATESNAKKRSFSYKLLSVLSRFDPSGRIAERINGAVVYRNLVDVKTEAPKAAHAYGLAIDQMNEVMDELKAGKGMRIDRIKESVTPVIDSVLRNQDAMAWLVYLRKRDEYAYTHSIATSVWATILGRHLGFDRAGLQTLAMGGMLLDIGRVKIPESITDQPGPLSEDEYELVKMHVDYGVDIAKKTPGINDDVLDMIACHHERHDGSGYPKGLEGADIPVFGRIAALVDCYDAMISPRTYAKAKSTYDALRELNILSGVSFQRELVEQFVQALGMFPTGNVVELNTGEVAIVIEQNRVRRLRPKIRLVLDAKHQPIKKTKIVDLNRVPSDADDRKAIWISKGHEPGAFGIEPKDFF